MMKLMKLTTLVFLLINSFIGFSQFTTGALKMEVKGIKMNGEDAPPEMASVLGAMDISIFSNGTIQKSVINMMMMKTTNIVDLKADSIFMYLDIMGKMYKIAQPRSATLANADTSNPVQIIEHPEDTREILGFKCHRYDIKMSIPSSNSKETDVQEMNLKLYVTNELNFDPSFVTQSNHKLKIKGTPLAYNMVMGGGAFQMELLMEAKSFDKEINPKDMLPPEGVYKNYTMEEFQKEMSNRSR
ncbi:MAG: hypothetical protein WAR77_00950 [Saprospiraceae bacterium]